MTKQFAWTFPGGKKCITKDTSIAGNVGTVKTVPTGKLWLLLNVMVELTTDGTVANRIPQIFARDDADVNKFKNYGATVTATSTEVCFFTRGAGNVGVAINELGFQLLAVGEDVLIAIDAGVAGDSYDYLIEYLELPS